MENKRQQSGASSFDHLFGPKDSSSSSSSSSSSVFGSIFSPPSTGLGRDTSGIIGNQAGNGKYGNPDNSTQSNKGISKDSSYVYQNETVEPCYFSSSIYYGGQENYSPRTKNSESHHTFKKDDRNDDPNGNNSNSASRGNWWQGSLYY
ncbi:hypothetical protein P3X46_025638 [Hevea brasiliensis]|uniref:Uncharacterized protein n=1 Tax=Hevea brasiliensis TaxID=3981 RepID=A0ABQ9L9R3_HEVBR|nr:uncharacterized protein LOC110649691 isoform X2 [Hevea brasiliensis]KAJ9160217.1 hypothetical protein P3X46_025638 [Hevea brasiliensis]